MYSQKAKSIIAQGDQFLDLAQQEMFKAEEDAVPYMICSNARQSLVKYFSAFLVNHDIEDELPQSVTQLHEMCKKRDARFNELEMDNLGCSDQTHDVAYCTDLNKVKICVDIAKKAKQLLEEEPWPLSRPVK